MSQEQRSGLLIGDEAYAGSRNFERLEESVRTVLGQEHVCPTHNWRGSLKLITLTMVRKGDVVVSNSRTPAELTQERLATSKVLRDNTSPFAGNINLDHLQEELSSSKVPYVYVETFAEGYLPVSLSHLKEVRAVTERHGTKLILNASRVVENALFIRQHESEYRDKPLGDLVREMVKASHISILDAGQDPRCNAGGLISTDNGELHLIFQNEVVVYEGLHTYGGMAGRTMEIFARGIEEMVYESQALWVDTQARRLAASLEGIPLLAGSDGVYLRTAEFLPYVKNHKAHALAAALYLKTGVRAFLEGCCSDDSILPVQIPRLALSNLQLDQIAESIKELYAEKEKITSFGLTNLPVWNDEARFEFECPDLNEYRFTCEPYVIHTIEYVGITSREERKAALENAGYNSFLILSRDVTLDLLTDSGTAAMSVEQWQSYDGADETQATSRNYLEFIEAVREITGYRFVIPTHQGRAAEHIMSQVMIRGGFVPGNMYFTTTKLHQELAGGTFVDVIVDEAHDPASRFPWKGNVDISKLDALVKKHGAERFPYISFEMCVNMAGGQPFSMDNARELYDYCKKKGVPVMFDATRAVENAYMIKRRDPRYKDWSIKSILHEVFQYGDGCTVSSKKDCLVNIGGFLAYRNDEDLYRKSLTMLRKYEGSSTNGGLSAGDLASQTQGIKEMVSEDYIRSRVEQVQYLGGRLLDAGVPIVEPPGTHAIFLDARRFLPHLDQGAYPAQALAAAIFLESGIRAMERGNVSKGRDPETGREYRPALELVRLTIPRRVYTNAHMDVVAEAIIALYKKRDRIKGLRFTYEPAKLRFFLGRFEEIEQ
jgi:tyrosine phenol-lyase